MKMPVALDRKIEDLKEEEPSAYEFVQTFFRLFITKNGMVGTLGLEAAMEELEGLVNKGWARIVFDGELVDIAAWRPDLEAWWMNGEVVKFDE
jgi:hypothetical protein